MVEVTKPTEEDTDDDENMKGFFSSGLNFVSPSFLLLCCQIHSFLLLVSFHLSHPGPALQILPQSDLFLPPYVAKHAGFTSDTHSPKSSLPVLSLFTLFVPAFIVPALLEAHR